MTGDRTLSVPLYTARGRAAGVLAPIETGTKFKMKAQKVPITDLPEHLRFAAAGEAMRRDWLGWPKFRMLRMVYGLITMSPALYLIGAFVFSVCLLLAAFTL